MCELLGMSANVPTDICFNFTGLMERGGHTGPHRDGWGIAFYEDRGCRVFQDPQPSADSEIARLIHRYPIKSRTLRHCRPIGTTDSEHAFCYLLDAIRERFPRKPASPEALTWLVTRLCTELRQLGNFNILLSDGRFLFAHCSTHLGYLTRRAPFGQARLLDAEVIVDFERETTPNDIVTVIATRPLTSDESWHVMPPDSIEIFIDGLPRHSPGADLERHA